MEIIVSSEISLLMETADLLCSYVNGQNPATLTADTPCCIPAQEIQKMMDAAFGDLDLEDQRLNFYFQGHEIVGFQDGRKALSCVGVMLIGTALQTDGCDIRSLREQMHRSTAGECESYAITSFTPFALGLVTRKTYSPLFAELGALDMPEALRMKLLETLSNFHYHVDRLCDLLEPLAQRLLPMLQPWWDMASSRLEQWNQTLETEDGRQRMLSEINMDTTGIDHMNLSLRFFNVGYNRCKYDVERQRLYYYLSLDKLPGGPKEDVLSSLEVSALRLLSSPDRVEMLKSMSGRVMSAKEITKEMGMNPGSVFRDLNSLFYAKLIDMVVEGTHRSYTTNMENFENLLRRLYGYVKSGR